MTTVDEIPKTYDQAMRVLARWNGEGGARDLEIYAFPDADEHIVRLLHISAELPDVGGITVYQMGRSEEFPFRSAVALAVPKYWERIQQGERLLPQDWNLQTMRKVWPSEGT